MIASVAVVTASAGAAAAGALVTSAGIKDDTVRSVDLKNGYGVRGIDVTNGSLGWKDLNSTTQQLILEPPSLTFKNVDGSTFVCKASEDWWASPSSEGVDPTDPSIETVYNDLTCTKKK